MITLKEWQQDAMNNLKSTLTGGTVQAATGSGKTILGLKLIEDNPTSKFLIVVPTIVLMNQWKKEITTTFKLATIDEIALMGGGSRDLPNKRITIAIINSLRSINWNHPLATFDYSLFDECHRYASEENIKPLLKGNLGFKVGLTATLRRPDGREIELVKEIGRVVYTLTRQDSIDAGYVSDYNVHLIECKMNQQEAREYFTVDSEVKEYMKIFNGNFNSIKGAMRGGPRHVLFRQAVQAMKSIQERKSKASRIKSKVQRAVEICARNQDKKIILFDSLQESANEIYKELTALGIKSVIYHSGIGAKLKKTAIQKYIADEVNIIISVKCLDEGLDVKKADLGIIVNGNSQEREVSQRLGRLLRLDGDKVAELYMLYTPGTIDEKYIQKRMMSIGKSGEDEDGFES